MLAQNNEFIREASDTIYQLTQEEKIRLQCEAREDYYRRQRTSIRRYEAACAELDAAKTTIEKQADKITEQTGTIAEQADKISEQASTISEQADKIAELNDIIAALRAQQDGK